MADDVTVHNGGAGTGTPFDVATDDDGSGNHIQLMKLAYSANGSRAAVDADADGLKVKVSGGQVTAAITTAKGSAVSSGLTIATTNYTAGDQMGAIMEVTGMAANAGGGGFIGSALLLCD